MCKQRWGNREMLSITAQLDLTGLGKVFDRQTSVNIFIIKMCRRTGVKLTKVPCFMKMETPVDSDCNPEPIPTVSEVPWWVWVEMTTFLPPLRKSDFSRALFRVGFLSHCWKFHTWPRPLSATNSPLLSSCTLSTDAGLEEDVWVWLWVRRWRPEGSWSGWHLFTSWRALPGMPPNCKAAMPARIPAVGSCLMYTLPSSESGERSE